MPQLGETVAEGKITKWFVTPGTTVKPGDNLFEIETDKVSMEVPSITAGTLTEIRVPVGETALVGAVVAVIAGEGGAAASAPAPAPAAPAPKPQQTPFVSAKAGTQGQIPAAVPGIPERMLDAASQTVAGGAPWSIAQIGPGTPLKVFTVAWASGPGSVAPFLVGAALNRITRIAPTLAAAAAVGAMAPGWLRRHDRLVIGGSGVAWVAFYALYLLGLG